MTPTGKRISLLKSARIAVSLAVAAVITASAAGITVSVSEAAARWLASVQIFTAVLSFSMVIFVVWLLVTLLFGRVYCSSVCPLGTLMDVASRSVRLTRLMRRRRPYRWRRPVPRIQYTILVATLIAMMGGISWLVSLTDPYTVYTDIVAHSGLPLLGRSGTSAAGRVLTGTLAGYVVSWILLVLVYGVAAVSGRTLCNTVCPVGTTLGLISRYSVMQIDIDTDRCVRCGACVDACKAGCISPADWTVDGTRCVACFDCLPVCPNDAIHYTGRRHQLSDVMMQRVTPSAGQAAATPINSSNPTTTDHT